MSYKLFTDKQELFEAKLHLEGSSYSKANVRLIVEGQNINLLYYGTVNSQGQAQVPIKKLKGLLDEGEKGKIKLEVIVEDTWFECWTSDFVVDTEKKLKVEVVSQTETQSKPDKPKVQITEVNHPFDPVESITEVLQKQGMTPESVLRKKHKVIPIMSKYLEQTEYEGGIKKFIREVIHKLANK